MAHILPNKHRGVNIIRALSVFVAIFVLMLPCLVQGEPVLLPQLLQRAEALHLDQQAGWHNLLHYKSHVFGGVYSQADDERFFLAPDGKLNAHAELVATLKALLEDNQEYPVRCRFPARLHWLDTQLHFKNQLPSLSCSEFEIWQQKINTSHVTLVFPAMYLNNPASMFGHTFLRLDQTNKSSLLSYTLSYGAQSDPDDNALQYVMNGLAGGYKGVFSVQPYYETVQAYGDIEHRDIWEYTLNLNQEEVKQLLRHAWEIKNIHFDYYFLRENCSYRLLSLLDVARPGINMTHDHLPVYALPVDTVKLIANAGLINATHYRPSITSRLQQMYLQLDEKAQITTRNMVQVESDDRFSALDAYNEIEQARILELASDWLQFTNKDNAQKNHELLLARSRIEVSAEAAAFVFDADNPLESHGTVKTYLSYGKQEQQHFFDLGFRPAFHDLTDSVRGFSPGAAIKVLDTRLRWYEDEQRLQLQQLDLFSLTALVPVRPWSKPVSAKLSVNINRRLLTNNVESKFLSLDMGMGYSAEWAPVIVYAMADMAVDYSRKLDDNHAVYVGGELGALMITDKNQILATIWLGDSISGEQTRKEVYHWQFQHALTQQHALMLQYETKIQFIRETCVSADYIYYF